MPKVLFIKWTLLAIFLHYTITMNAQNHKEQQLTAQQQSIARISALTATGDLEKLKVQLNIGLDSGLTVSEIKEVLVQLYAYCGFPRSLNGINTFMSVIADRTGKGIKDPEGKNASPIPAGDIGIAMNTGLTQEQLQEAFAIIDTMIGKKEVINQ